MLRFVLNKNCRSFSSITLPSSFNKDVLLNSSEYFIKHNKKPLTNDVFAIVDINKKQVKVNINSRVMTHSLNISPFKQFRREFEAKNNIRGDKYTGVIGKRLDDKLEYFWNKLSSKEKESYTNQHYNIGDIITLNHILLISNNDGTLIGSPLIKNAQITATIEEHNNTDEMIIFKKKRRKRYQRTYKHTTPISILRINEISFKYNNESFIYN